MAVIGGWGLIARFVVPPMSPMTPLDELIYLMNDQSWLRFIGGVTMFLGLPIVCAIAAFADGRERPVFPRWFGYYNAWAVVLVIPDQLLFFFQAGPFAWNGRRGVQWVNR